MKRAFLIGTRGSRLALAQTKQIEKLLRLKNPKLHTRLVIVKTIGDEFQSVELFKKNNIGVFTKKLEEKLLSGEIDLAVHSLKDLPVELPKGLMLAAIPKRLDPSDVLISKNRFSVETLPAGSNVGAGSPRRRRQIYHLRPDLNLFNLRGNLDARVKKVLTENKYDAVILAKAGLLRLKKYQKFTRTIPPEKLLPAVGQAALGLEVRSADKEARVIVKKLNHRPSEIAVTMERRFLEILQGGCRVPVGVYSKICNKKISMKAAVFSIKTEGIVTGEISRPIDQFIQAGEVLARQMLKKGADIFLNEARDV